MVLFLMIDNDCGVLKLFKFKLVVLEFICWIWFLIIWMIFMLFCVVFVWVDLVVCVWRLNVSIMGDSVKICFLVIVFFGLVWVNILVVL